MRFKLLLSRGSRSPDVMLLGSLSNYDGDGNKSVTKQYVLISKAMPCTRVLHFGTFLSRFMENVNTRR